MGLEDDDIRVTTLVANNDCQTQDSLTSPPTPNKAATPTQMSTGIISTALVPEPVYKKKRDPAKALCASHPKRPRKCKLPSPNLATNNILPSQPQRNAPPPKVLNLDDLYEKMIGLLSPICQHLESIEKSI